ncbi:hypothetical protein GCM10027174_03090 [Salinifilum aidingensis]
MRIALPRRAAEVWDTSRHGWRLVPGDYTAEIGRSTGDPRLRTRVRVGWAGSAPPPGAVTAAQYRGCRMCRTAMGADRVGGAPRRT